MYHNNYQLFLLFRFIKRETSLFFGLDEEFEETEKLKWLERRKRLATRKYGELKNEYICSVNEIPTAHTSQVIIHLSLVFLIYLEVLILIRPINYNTRMYNIITVIMFSAGCVTV